MSKRAGSSLRCAGMARAPLMSPAARDSCEHFGDDEHNKHGARSCADIISAPQSYDRGSQAWAPKQGQRFRGWWWWLLGSPKQATCIQQRFFWWLLGYKNRTRYSMIGEILLTRDFISCPGVGNWSSALLKNLLQPVRRYLIKDKCRPPWESISVDPRFFLCSELP